MSSERASGEREREDHLGRGGQEEGSPSMIYEEDIGTTASSENQHSDDNGGNQEMVEIKKWRKSRNCPVEESRNGGPVRATSHTRVSEREVRCEERWRPRRRRVEEHSINTTSRILCRELGLGRLAGTGGRNMQRERFRNLKLQGLVDLNHDENHRFVHLHASAKKQIKYIYQHDRVLFALLECGLLITFDRRTNSRLCMLNQQHDDEIKNFFWNPRKESIIIVSNYSRSRSIDIRCSSIELESIVCKNPHHRRRIFRKAEVQNAEDVKICIIEMKAVLKSWNVIQIYDLSNYTLLREIPIVDTTGFEGFNTSEGMLVLKYWRDLAGGTKSDSVDMLCINTANLLHRHVYPWKVSNEITFLDVIGSTILLGHKNMRLKMIFLAGPDAGSSKTIGPPTPTRVKLIRNLKLLVMTTEKGLYLYNSKGHIQWQVRQWNMNRITASEEAKIIISYCADRQGSSGAIIIIDTITGQKISEVSEQLLKESSQGSTETISNALSEVAAIGLNDESSEILTGNKEGFIYIWAS